MKKLLLILFALLPVIAWSNFPPYHLEHYSTKDGLPQQTVNGVLQDKKGFMWFTTWDGFCKYDGYGFKTYEVQSNDSYYMKSNRSTSISEDKYGYIWIQSYDGEAHRFDPRTETFQGIQTEQYPHFSFFNSRLEVKPSGKVWLLSSKTGGVCVLDSTFKTVVYGTENDHLIQNKIVRVFEDRSFDSWLLTDNGLGLIPKGDTKPQLFFCEKKENSENTKQAFYCALESDDSIWFGSDKGHIWRYIKADKQFKLINIDSDSPVINMVLLSDKSICIITRKDGLFICQPITGKIEHFSTQGSSGFPGNEIRSIFKDHRDIRNEKFGERFWVMVHSKKIIEFTNNSKGEGEKEPNKNSSVNKVLYASCSYLDVIKS